MSTVPSPPGSQPSVFGRFGNWFGSWWGRPQEGVHGITQPPPAPREWPMEPKEVYGATADMEKMASGPRAVTLPWFLPFWDQQDGETQETRLAYRQMLRDPVVKGAVLGKLYGVAALDIKITPVSDDPGDIEVAEFVDWSFSQRIKGSVPKMVESIVLHAMMDGYSVNEKVWGVEEEYGRWQGKHVLRNLKPKDVDRDLVLKTDEFRNVTSIMGLRYNGGLEFDPRDFVIFTHLPLFESPTGTSDFRSCYGRYWVLDTAWKLRAAGLANRSYPILKGQYATIDQKATLEKAMAAAKFNSFIAVPAGAVVEALEIAGRSQDEFRNAIADLREEIFLGIQLAMLQALTGQSGAQRGSSAAHKDTSDLAKWYLAQLFCACLNDHESGLIRDLVVRNFHGRVPPKAAMSGIDDMELAESLVIDKGLADLGWKGSRRELGERYGRDWQKDDDDALQPAAAQQPQQGGMGTGGPQLPEPPEFHDDPEMTTDWGYNNGMMGDAA